MPFWENTTLPNIRIELNFSGRYSGQSHETRQETTVYRMYKRDSIST
jgi:hypothetical protein